MVETFVPPGEEDASLPSEDRLLPEEAIAVVMFVVASVLAGLQILLRAAFDIGLIWGQELVVVLIIWSVFIGASAVTARRRHVRMDLLATSLPRKPGAVVEIVAASAVLLYVLFVLAAGLRFQSFIYHSHELDPSTEVPSWWLFLGMPLGLLFMAFRATNDLRARVRTLRGLL